MLLQWAANNYAREGKVTQWKLLLLTNVVHEPTMPLIRLLNQKQCAKNIVTYHISERKPVCFLTGNRVLINITWGLKQHLSFKIVVSTSNAPLFLI